MPLQSEGVIWGGPVSTWLSTQGLSRSTRDGVRCRTPLELEEEL